MDGGGRVCQFGEWEAKLMTGNEFGGEIRCRVGRGRKRGYL
jgi:hypothetical protein